MVYYSPYYVVESMLVCLLGTQMCLVLANTSLELGMHTIRGLTAICFGVQCVFTLHFIGMLGMNLDINFGFDLMWLLASLFGILLFGCTGIWLTLSLRSQAETKIRVAFPEYPTHPSSQTVKFQFRLLFFLLREVPTSKLLLALLLLVLGVASCHHSGMWSMSGLDGAIVHSHLNLWTLATTLGIGGVVCIVCILIFLVCPRGICRLLASSMVTIGIAAFHYSSSLWGINYVQGIEGLGLGPVLDHGAILVLVLLQGIFTTFVCLIFSNMAIKHNRQQQHELEVAQRLTAHIAQMDMDQCKEMKQSLVKGNYQLSRLEKWLFQIVANLEEYRPFLPDHLFIKKPTMADQASDSSSQPDPVPANTLHALPVRDPSLLESFTSSRSLGRTPSSVQPEPYFEVAPVPSTPSPPHSRMSRASTSRSIKPLRTSSSPSNARTPCTPSSSAWGLSKDRLISVDSVGSSRPPSWASPIERMGLGLKERFASVLYTRLHQVDLSDIRRTERHLLQYILRAHQHIKSHLGIITNCYGDTAISVWWSRCPSDAIRTAIAIQQEEGLVTTQVIKSGRFLIGNLGDEKVRYFNVVGTPVHAIQQMLGLGVGHRSDVFITESERESAMYEFNCLPYGALASRTADTAEGETVFCVLPSRKPVDEDEWMYCVEDHANACEQTDRMLEVWNAYREGKKAIARKMLRQLNELPPWYVSHMEEFMDRKQTETCW